MTQVKITLDVQVVDADGKIQIKVESDDHGEKSDDPITVPTPRDNPWIKEYEMGSNRGQNIWIWWDTIYGEVMTKIEVEVGGVYTTVFQGECKNHLQLHWGERSIGATCTNPVICLRENSVDSGPYLLDSSAKDLTYIKFK